MRIGMRLWLTAAFAAVSLVTAVAVYLFGDKPQALIAAVALGVLAGLLIAVALVTTRVMDVDIASGIAPADLALSAAWFVLGYALYCNAYAAAGSLVSRVEDAQTVAFPIMLPLLFGYIVSFSIAGGASTLLWVLAFIPFTGVIAMPTLYAVGEAELWQVGLSMALTVVAIVAVSGVAAKVYERSVLHSGRRLGWKEAFGRPDEIARS